eukprot:c35128_g1_i1 orf=55-207(-)
MLMCLQWLLQPLKTKVVCSNRVPLILDSQETTYVPSRATQALKDQGCEFK